MKSNVRSSRDCSRGVSECWTKERIQRHAPLSSRLFKPIRATGRLTAYLAEMLLGVGEWRLAWPHLSKMEVLDAESVVGNYLMARYWHQRKELEQARGYADKVRQARPAHAELRNLLGQIYLGLNQLEKARDEFQAAVRLAPDRADFRENLQKLERYRQRE